MSRTREHMFTFRICISGSARRNTIAFSRPQTEQWSRIHGLSRLPVVQQSMLVDRIRESRLCPQRRPRELPRRRKANWLMPQVSNRMTRAASSTAVGAGSRGASTPRRSIIAVPEKGPLSTACIVALRSKTAFQLALPAVHQRPKHRVRSGGDRTLRSVPPETAP